MSPLTDWTVSGMLPKLDCFHISHFLSHYQALQVSLIRAKVFNIVHAFLTCDSTLLPHLSELLWFFFFLFSLWTRLTVWMLHSCKKCYKWCPWILAKICLTMSHVPCPTHILYFEGLLLSFSKLLRCSHFNSCVLDMRKERN